MSTPVIITVPKFVNSPIFKDYVDCKSPDVSKGRKRRLDHLTWEEKLQRKKLKNRVAAQTSRDRKKQKMEEMEITVKDLMDHNQLLLEEMEELRLQNKKLMTENQQLRSSSVSQCTCACSQRSSVPGGQPRPAESLPLPQGGRAPGAAALGRRALATLLLLSRICWSISNSSTKSPQNSISPNLKSLRTRSSKISPVTWKQLIQKHKLQEIVNTKIREEKWWGRHQNNWNPVETSA